MLHGVPIDVPKIGELLVRKVSEGEGAQVRERALLDGCSDLIEGEPHDVRCAGADIGGEELLGHRVPLLHLDLDVDARPLLVGFEQGGEHSLTAAFPGWVEERPHGQLIRR